MTVREPAPAELEAPTPLAGVEPGFVTRPLGHAFQAPTPLAGVEPRFVTAVERF